MRMYVIFCLLRAVLLACITMASSTVLASQNELHGEQADQLMQTLVNALWIPDGSATDKQIYVFYSTNCGISKRFYEDTRQLTSKVQFRWITNCCTGKGGEYAIEQHTPEAIGAVFNNRGGKIKNVERAKREMGYNLWAANKVPGLNRYPTVVYRTNNSVVVSHGYPSDINKMIASVASRPERANHDSPNQAFLDKAVVITPLKNLNQYINRDSKKSLPVYIHPDKSSQKVAELQPKHSYKVIGATNKEWVAVVGLNSGAGLVVPGYIHAPLDMKLAQLDMKVRPASGKLQIQKPTEVRFHPDMEAPVAEILKTNWVMTITGEVSLGGKNWKEIKYLTDGTKGYVLQ